MASESGDVDILVCQQRRARHLGPTAELAIERCDLPVAGKSSAQFMSAALVRGGGKGKASIVNIRQHGRLSSVSREAAAPSPAYPRTGRRRRRVDDAGWARIQRQRRSPGETAGGGGPVTYRRNRPGLIFFREVGGNDGVKAPCGLRRGDLPKLVAFLARPRASYVPARSSADGRRPQAPRS